MQVCRMFPNYIVFNIIDRMRDIQVNITYENNWLTKYAFIYKPTKALERPREKWLELTDREQRYYLLILGEINEISYINK